MNFEAPPHDPIEIQISSIGYSNQFLFIYDAYWDSKLLLRWRSPGDLIESTPGNLEYQRKEKRQ